MKRLAYFTFVAALGLGWYLALPPAPRGVSGAAAGPRHARGVIHVHTDRSDGTGSLQDVAEAAARAGLDFVILTDHGDGTRPPLPPQYYGSVLLIDAVEVSTDGGHVVALDLPEASYPLAGEPRDVLEDIARAGAFAIAAHPGSPKDELRWADWEAPVDGLEWLNADSEWRDEPWPSLARALLTYPARGASSLALLLDRPDPVLQRWDALTQRGRVVGVAASDAHARIGLTSGGEPYDNRASVPVPSYEQMFRALTIALPGVALQRDAAADARQILDAIRGGHVYSVIDAVAGPGALTFTGMSGGASASMGDRLPAGDVVFTVAARAPDDARIELRRNGQVIAAQQGRTLEHRAAEPGVYRVEVLLPGAPGTPPVPWILSNPIYVGGADAPPIGDAPQPAARFEAVFDDGPAEDWAIEASAASTGALDVIGSVGGGTQLSLRYALGGAESDGPYVALVAPAGPEIAEFDRLVFTARARQPMRVSVQLRAGEGDGQRWQRSVYLDATPRTITVRFDDMHPVAPAAADRPALADVRNVLWVVDTVNTALGGSGEVLLDAIRYGR